MNKIEARILLVIITFFASVQYAFIGAIGEEYSPFGFSCLSNLIGLFLMCFVFGSTIISEFYRYTKKVLLQSLLLAVELTGFNVFMLIGASDEAPTVSAGILSSFFIFIPVVTFFIRFEKPKINIIIASVVAILGVLLVSEFDVTEPWSMSTLALIAADICFALYTVTVGKLSTGVSPTFLAIGQLFWCVLLTGVLWVGEVSFLGGSFEIPDSPAFVIAVCFVGIFLKGIYTLSQINAQRFVTPIETSLIFASEILMTMFVSPFLSLFMGTQPEVISLKRVAGALLVIVGILAADDNLYNKLKRNIKRVKGGRTS